MTDKPKTCAEMTDAEKGALLLAYHEGKTIQTYGPPKGWLDINDPRWLDFGVYRIKPEPKRKTVTLYTGRETGWEADQCRFCNETHRITFDVIDREPDCASIKMERLDD